MQQCSLQGCINFERNSIFQDIRIGSMILRGIKGINCDTMNYGAILFTAARRQLTSAAVKSNKIYKANTEHIK